MSAGQGTSVFNEQRGYRRGLILGFTMAESMLLLVFCLLLAAGALIMKAQDDLKKAEATKVEVQTDLTETKKELALLTEELNLAKLSASPSADMSELWKELSLSRKAVSDMRTHSVTLQDAVDNAVILRQLLDGNLTPEVIKEVETILKELKQKGLGVEDIRKLAEISDQFRQLNLAPEEAKKLEPAIDLIKQTLLASQDKTAKEILEDIITKAAEAEAAKAELVALAETETDSKPHVWPPIINLSETKGYSFKSGSAELDPRFQQVLETTVAKQIADTARQYGVDVIEVVGHTDEQGMGKRQSNMDYDLKPVLEGIAPVFTLQPGDNAGLGLARAIAVTQALKSHPDLTGLTILPMSGAQLILPNDSLTNGAQMGDVASRRRIEIRVRKRNQKAEEGESTLDPTPLVVNAPPLEPASRTIETMEVFNPEPQPARIRPASGGRSTMGR